jgi:hypothetical protein
MSNGSDVDRWDPAGGDYVPVDSTEEVKNLKNRIRKQSALIFILSLSTISIFLAAIYYFSIV